MVILACSSCAEIVEGLQHRRPPAKDTGLKQESQLVNDVVSHLSLRFLFIFFLSLFRDDGNLIVVSAESSARITGRVEHDEVGVFLHSLLLCITLFIVGFQGESYDSLIFLFHLSQSCCDVMGRHQCQLQVILFALDFLIRYIGRTEVCYGCTENGSIR